LTLQRDGLFLTKRFAEWAGLSHQIYFQDRIDEYRSIWQGVAAARGATFIELAQDLWQIDLDGTRVRVLNHELEFDDPVTLGLAGRKHVVHRLLGEAGIAVPEHAVFTLDELDIARRFVERHPDGCVIKPSGGYGGKGVTTHVRSAHEVRGAAILAAVYGRQLLIERMVPGEAFRLLVLEGRVVDVVWRRAPRVEADGVSTVRTLLDRENRRRRDGGLPLIRLDRDTLFTLGHQGLTPDSTPDLGRIVVIRSTEDRSGGFREVRTVYNHSATDIVCDAIRRDAEHAAQIVGADFLGVDVITPDPSVPLAESGGVINEVNTTPALHHHYDAARESYPALALVVFDALVRRNRTRDAERGSMRES
jgi:cyanophycin synthetase